MISETVGKYKRRGGIAYRNHVRVLRRCLLITYNALIECLRSNSNNISPLIELLESECKDLCLFNEGFGRETLTELFRFYNDDEHGHHHRKPNKVDTFKGLSNKRDHVKEKSVIFLVDGYIRRQEKGGYGNLDQVEWDYDDDVLTRDQYYSESRKFFRSIKNKV